MEINEMNYTYLYETMGNRFEYLHCYGEVAVGIFQVPHLQSRNVEVNTNEELRQRSSRAR